MEACHDDGDCTNDSPCNLRWDTPESNKEDMKRHGTDCVGTRSSTVKLTDKKVVEIRDARLRGETLSRIASEFGVTEANISYICNRKTWKHI